MRLSAAWLRDYVETNWSPDELAERLTMLGVEIEDVFPLAPGIEEVVVARIERVSPHPNANRLRICSVNVGDETLEVVCGAPNARQGMVAPLAPVGAKLPNGMEALDAKIRSVRSRGMLCSEKELGVSEEADGLMELPDNLTPGDSLVKALGLDDTILDVSVTPNRPDCLSMVGVAREVATVSGLALKRPETTVSEGDAPTAEATSVQIDDAVLCPRYAARVIRGVKIGPSPVWLQRRVRSAGMRPINNVVDATNYVLMELGHPLHAFDYDKLAGNRIVVRRAKSGEALETLDGQKWNLTTETLVIADAEKPVALAGIMGGASSEVTATTENVLLESAYFNPVSIRRTAKAMGLQTEASYRFERGADPEAVVPAIDRAAHLILETAGGSVCKGVLDVYPEPIDRIELTLRPERANAVLGANIQTDEMVRILTGLGFEASGDDPIQATVPTYRPDIAREIDLIEEVARVYGYDKIASTLPAGDIPAPTVDETMELRRRYGAVMRRCGLNEACNAPWQSKSALDAILLDQDDPLRNQIAVENPLSGEMAVLRTSLLPSLLENVAYNRRHQVNRVRLYELQRVFIRREDTDLPDERWTLGGALCGDENAHWSSENRELDFFDVKGIVEELLSNLNVEDWSLSQAEHPTFHPGRSANLEVGGESVGVFGEAHPDALDAQGIAARTYLFEIDVDALSKHVAGDPVMDPLPPFPSVVRDLAIVLDEDVPADDVQRAIRGSVADLLQSVRLFDLYVGERIGEGKKSLAFALEYRSPERTLTDTEIERLQSQILHTLRNRFGAELRG